jgi:hypothetical protein
MPTSSLTDQQRRHLDETSLAVRKSLLDLVPSAPGTYVDDEGDLWVLTAGAIWTDMNGHTEHRRYNWVLGQFNLVAADNGLPTGAETPTEEEDGT